MLEFAKGGTVPPGGMYFYSDPNAGIPLIQERSNFGELVNRVRAAYLASGKPCPEPLVRVIEDYVCRHVPPEFCFGHTDLPRMRTMTPQEVKANTTRLSLSPGRADPGTVRSRMAICGACRENSRLMCLSCTGLTDWAVGLAGRTRVGQDDSLGICACDKVLLSLLVSLKLTPPADNAVLRPEKCWRIPDGR